MHGSVPWTIRVQVKQETPDFIRPEGKGGKTRRRMASKWQINGLLGLFAVKMIRQQISLTNRLQHQQVHYPHQ